MPPITVVPIICLAIAPAPDAIQSGATSRMACWPASKTSDPRMSHWASVRSMPLNARKIDPSHLYYLPGMFYQIIAFIAAYL